MGYFIELKAAKKNGNQILINLLDLLSKLVWPSSSCWLSEALPFGSNNSIAFVFCLNPQAIETSA